MHRKKFYQAVLIGEQLETFMGYRPSKQRFVLVSQMPAMLTPYIPSCAPATVNSDINNPCGTPCVPRPVNYRVGHQYSLKKKNFSRPIHKENKRNNSPRETITDGLDKKLSLVKFFIPSSRPAAAVAVSVNPTCLMQVLALLHLPAFVHCHVYQRRIMHKQQPQVGLKCCKNRLIEKKKKKKFSTGH